jgi:hypothetical protein
MDILYLNKRGKFLNILEQFHIYDKKKNMDIDTYREMYITQYLMMSLHIKQHSIA